MPTELLVNVEDISIHAPSRERHNRSLLRNNRGRISIHAPSRERLFVHEIIKTVIKFQSTLPHGSDSCIATEIALRLAISIHAPSRERPGDTNNSNRVQIISIHAPSRERPGEAAKERYEGIISIHAPSRERHQQLGLSAEEAGFQSTLPHGSDEHPRSDL